MSKIDELINKKRDLKYLLDCVCKEIAAERLHMATGGEIGNKYGLLKVVELSETRRSKKYFKCVCDCGKDAVVAMSQLRNGRTKSCGCLRATKAKNNIIINRIAKQRDNREGVFDV